MVTLGQIKADLKKIGCKFKSQLDGNWAIFEPKGNRIIVSSLEEAHAYYLSKSSGSAHSGVASNPVERDITQVKQAPLPTQVKPVPDEVKQAIAAAQPKQAPLPTQVRPVPEELKQTLAPTQVGPVPDEVRGIILSSQRASAKTAVTTNPDARGVVDQAQVKVNLKKIGCKLKSQMNGDWAIFEPKGNRVFVSSLEEAHQYYLDKTGGAGVIPQPPVKNGILPGRQQEVVDPNKTVEMQVVPSPIKITHSNRKITRSSQAVKNSAELSAAIEKANHVINLLKERRLKMGINVTHTDLKDNLLSKVCSAELLDDVIRYVETRLDKDCIDRVLVKRHFKNHLGNDDVMYFDIRYANLLATV